MYVTEVLKSEITKWGDGTTVFIKAVTGAGKSTFVIKELLPAVQAQGGEILYVSNRKLLHQQLISEVCKLYEVPFELMCNETVAEFSGITFTTYQALQEKMETWIDIQTMPFFSYIVLDEVHYLAADSDFNPGIQRILRWLRVVRCQVLMAISATIEPALPYLGFYNSGWEMVAEYNFTQEYERFPKNVVRSLKGMPERMFFYNIPAESPHYNIFVYDDIQQVVNRINQDKSGDKWLVFQSNKERVREKVVSQLIGENKFISAEDKESKVIKEIVEKQQFSTRILITTKVLDNGVSIVDPKLRNLVLETVDRTEFLQMLGRKRVTGEDINIYIPKFSKSYFSALLKNSILSEMEVVQTPVKTLESEIFRSINIYNICRKYFDVVDGKWMLNPIASNRLDERKQRCETMLRKLEQDEEAFVKEQLSWLGIEERFASVKFIKNDEKECAVNSLMDVLIRLRGRELDKEKQAEFRRKMTEMLKIICPERISHSQRMAGLSMINAALEQLEIEFRIISQGGKRKGEKSIWKITTL